MRQRNRRLVALAMFAAGLGVIAYVIAAVDRAALADAIAQGGWALVPIVFYRFVPLAADTATWRLMMDGPAPVSYVRLVAFRWIGESVNNLLPVAQVGGLFVRVRLLAATGFGTAASGASVMADFVLGLVAQVVFTISGLAALAMLAGWTERVTDVAVMVGLGIVLIGVFVALQGSSLVGRLFRLAGRLVPSGGFVSGAGLVAMEEHLRRTYARRGALVGGTLWRLLGWALHAGEVWLILHFMGHPVGYAEAVVLESMSAAVRSAAFAVPAGVGVEEAGVVGVGLMLGLPAEVGLALALVRRARELLTSGPGLLAWMAFERHGFTRLFGRDRADRES